MALSYSDWDTAMDEMELSQVQSILGALKTLEEWDLFKKHWGWSRIFDLSYIASSVVTRKESRMD